MRTLLIISGLIFAVFLSSCTRQTNIPSEKNHESQIVYSYTGQDGVQKVITQSGTEYYDPQGFIVRNIKHCNNGHIGWYGYYDWYDYNADYTIKEAWCWNVKFWKVDPENWRMIPLFEDEWWTYYWDKEGGEYNVKRITTKTGGIRNTDLVIVDENGWVQSRINLLYFQNPVDFTHEVYYFDRLLSWVTSIYSLKILDLKDGWEIFITDGNNVWSNRDLFDGVDPSTLRYLKDWMYIDKNSCYIRLPLSEIKKLESCNPKTIKKLTEDPGNWMDTKMYSDGKNTYNAYGDLIEVK